MINREKAGERTAMMIMINASGGMEFDSKDNCRDVLWKGDCDEGCQMLAEKLGFGVSVPQKISVLISKRFLASIFYYNKLILINICS